MENLYEVMVLYKADLGEAGENKIFSRIDEIIKDNGKVIKTTNLGKRTLAYNIKKQTEGTYWVLDLNLNPQEVVPFTQKMSNEESILRFLLIKKEVKPVVTTTSEKATAVKKVSADKPAGKPSFAPADTKAMAGKKATAGKEGKAEPAIKKVVRKKTARSKK